MKEPSRDWKEIVADDEKAGFARQAEVIRATQAVKNAKYGKGRFLHRKPLVSVQALFRVPEGLDEVLRQGVFAKPGEFQAVVRLSHGSFDVQANTKPDIRGFAFKVLGLSGAGSLGGTTDHQDFLLINHEAFAARTSAEFLEVTAAAAKGQLNVLFMLIGRYGLGAALKRVQRLTGTLGKAFRGYNAESFFTAAPVAFGPYAVKVRLRPLNPLDAKSQDPRADVLAQLASAPLAYEVAVQFFVNEETTPIENPTVVWPEAVTPFFPVATLTLTAKEVDAEALKFDPWGGLADHRPLGELMRARKGAYFESQKGRNP